MAPLDKFNPSPVRTDNSPSLLDELFPSSARKAVGYGAASAVATDGVKLGIDALVFRGYNIPGGTTSWLQMNPASLTPEVSPSAPKWVGSWLSKMSPTGDLARTTASSAQVSAGNLAEQTTDFLRGAKAFVGEPKSVNGMADYWAACRNPALAISAKGSPLEVVKNVGSKLGQIGGDVERVIVMDNLAALKSEIGVAEAPVLVSTRRTLTGSLLLGVAVGGGTYLMDSGLSKLAGSTYGNDSTLAKVLAPTVLDSSLAAAGFAFGPTMQSKVALAATGWLCGKAISWVQS